MLEAGEDGVVAIAHEARAVRIVEKSNVLWGECFIVPPLYRWATRFAIASLSERINIHTTFLPNFSFFIAHNRIWCKMRVIWNVSLLKLWPLRWLLGA